MSSERVCMCVWHECECRYLKRPEVLDLELELVVICEMWVAGNQI